MKNIVIVLLFLFAICNPIESHNRADSVSFQQLLLQCRDSLLSPSFFTYYNKLSSYTDSTITLDNRISIKRMIMNRHYLLGMIDSLEISANDLMAFSKEHKDYSNLFNAWSLLLNHYILAGKTEYAISEASKMRDEAYNLNFPGGIATSMTLLGEAYLYSHIYSKSIAYFKEALRIYNADPDQSNHFEICSSLYSLNLALIGDKKYSEALIYSNKLDSVVSEMEEYQKDASTAAFRLVAMCARTISCSNIGEFKRAKAYLKRAGKCYAKCHTQLDYYLEAQAVYYYSVGDYQKALEIDREAIKYFGSLNLLQEKLRFIKYEAMSLQKLGNLQEACGNYLIYINGKDSLNQSNTFRQLNEYAITTDLKAVEIENKNLEIEIAKSNTRIIVIILLALVLITIICSYFLIRERRSNRKLSRALARAQESDKLKSAFLANISHEIRTPLNAIVGFSGMIANLDSTPEEMAQYKSIVNSNSEMLLTLINDILDLSKLESHSTELYLSQFDVVPYFKELAMSVEKRMKNDSVKLIVDNPYNQCIVSLDKTKLSQMLYNIINNSIKFTSIGYIKIAYEYSGNSLNFTIIDTGRGIEEDKIKHIFDRFYKIDYSLPGTGLGMSISKAIADAMKGTIEVSSYFGDGTTVVVRIPCEASIE